MNEEYYITHSVFVSRKYSQCSNNPKILLSNWCDVLIDKNSGYETKQKRHLWILEWRSSVNILNT